MSSENVSPAVMSLLKDWEKHLEKEAANKSPVSLKRTVLTLIALQGLDYSRLPKSLAREVVGLEEEIGSVFPEDFYHHLCQVSPSHLPLHRHLALSVSYGPAGVWTLTKGVSPVWVSFPVDSGEPDMEVMNIGKLVLQPNVEVTQADLASFLLLPPTTVLYDSLTEVTITKVDFNLPRKKLRLRGICKGGNGERLSLTTIIEPHVFDFYMTTLLYEREDQVEASFFTSAVFLPTWEEAVEHAEYLYTNGDSLENVSSDEELSFDFTSAASRDEIRDYEIDQDSSCDCNGERDYLCSTCLNNLTFGDDSDDEEEEEGDKEEKEDE